MKPIVIIFLFGAFITSNCFGQNNLKDLLADPVTSITVKSQFDTENPNETILVDKAAIDRIIIFIKQIELKEWEVTQASPAPEDYIFLISLNDRKDKIYLFKDAAFIAKTRYHIDMKVVIEFNNLVKAIISQ